MLTTARLLPMAMLVALLGVVHAAQAQQTSTDLPVMLEANQLGYDQQSAIVVAQGGVEVVQGETVLRADTLTYYQNRNLMRATGNVSVLQSTGDVYFANDVELTDDLKRGVVNEFRARLADNSVFAAREAEKENEYVTRLSKAVYSPCNLCKDSDPFWQIKADHVKIDELNQKVRYEDAQLEFFGVPVAYTPFLTHPTPDADAESGVLVPEYSNSSQLGTTVKVPYYWRIAPDKQATITPWYTTDDGPLLEGDYEQMFDSGSMRFSGSATYPKQRSITGQKLGNEEFRGHLYGKGEWDLTDFWRTGFDVARASDDTYIRRYGFGVQNALFSRGYVEGVEGRNYVLAQGLAIQGLRVTDDPNTTPLVLPTFEGYYETAPMQNGLRFHSFGNAQYLTRETGADQARVSITGGASLPVVTQNGQLLTARVDLRGDAYDINDYTIPTSNRRFDGTKTRAIPQASLEWRYPLMKRMESDSLTIEPVVLLVAQPSGGNPEEIPNEDNSLVELTDTNLFSLNRFPGLDTVDTGARAAYGLRGQYLLAGGDYFEGLLGQNYNADDDTPFPNSTTPGQHFSDYIGRMGYHSGPFMLTYRFALDEGQLTTNRNEVWTRLSHGGYSLTAAYLNLEQNSFIDDSEELLLNATAPVYAGWSITSSTRRDLKRDQSIVNNAGLLYQNECFNSQLLWQRIFTRDRDIEPSTSVMFRFGLKNLGEFGGS